MLRIGVLASHQGTNFQAVADACQQGSIDGSVVLLICNNSQAPVRKRASLAGIPSAHLSSRTHPLPADLDSAMTRTLVEADVNLIVLAGYMKKLGPEVLTRYKDRIINVHPSLLPRHGGEGFFGAHVHEAVIASGDTETGATVHLVNDEYDQGDVLLQEKIQVLEGETPDSLSERLHPIEHRLLITAIQQFAARTP